jgi:hypothetical protein
VDLRAQPEILSAGTKPKNLSLPLIQEKHMKLRFIAAAAAILASAASHGAIVAPNNANTAELMLVVWDADRSYTKDLGVTYAQFLAGSTTSGVFDTTLSGANWSSFLSLSAASQATWQYAVLTGRENNTPVNNSGVLSTINADSASTLADDIAGGTFDNSNPETAVAQISVFVGALNSTGTHGSTANGDSVNAKGTDAYYDQKSTKDFNASFYGNSSLVGTDMGMIRAVRTQTSTGVPVTQAFDGIVGFKQVAGNYALSYTVAAVPEASGYALALAGFGALGFVGVRRRNRT